MIAVRRALHEARRIVREHVGQRVRDDAHEFIRADVIPRSEQERLAVSQHAPCLPEARDLVGKEHHAKLADDRVEASVVERQRECIRLPPLQAPALNCHCCAIEHRLVEIGRNDIGFGQSRGDGARQHAGAGCCFQHMTLD